MDPVQNPAVKGRTDTELTGPETGDFLSASHEFPAVLLFQFVSPSGNKAVFIVDMLILISCYGRFLSLSQSNYLLYRSLPAVLR